MGVIAIDPGDKHVGIAWWYTDGSRHAKTLEAESAMDTIKNVIENVQMADGDEDCVLVIEEFRLYANKAMAQSWEPMLTSEMIGAIKYVAGEMDVEVVEQGAYIKNPTRKQLQARGIVQVGDTIHAKDAELHLIHYCLTEGIWKSRELL